LHERKEESTDHHLHEAANRVGMGDLPDRARDDATVAAIVFDEYLDARARDVFGVPTIQIDTDKVIFGPLVAEAPLGDDAMSLWEQTRGLSGRANFFELKRWPRDLRPGGEPVGRA
jgi:mycothiol-dependent nitroreductase-like protein